MDQEQEASISRQRKVLYLKLRSVFLLWFAADFAYHYNAASTGLVVPACLLGAFLVSQALMWGFPDKFYEGLVLTYGVFIFDLSFVLLSLYLMGQMAFHLMIALFLTLFMAAVAQSLVYTLLIAVVVCAAYLGQRLQTPEGFEVVKPSDFLDLPFILIVGMHAGTLVKESLKEHSEIFSLSTAKRLLKEELKKSARRIDELMEDTEAVFDALPLPVIVMDEFCILHAFNTQAESVFKFSRRKVLGREMKEVPLLVPLRKGFAEGLLGGKRPEVMEFKDYDGNPRQMLLGLVRTRDKKGSTSGVLGFLTAVNDVDDPGETLAVIYMPKPAAITPPAEPEPEPAPEEEDGPKKSGPGPAAPPPAASSSEMSMPL